MLQIISGKFYKSSDRYSSESRGILYSNYLWRDTIETGVVSIKPVEAYGPVSSYVIEYINQLEKNPISTGFQLIKTGDNEIIKQFKLLCSFGLSAYFDTEKNSVRLLCRKDKENNHDEILPSDFVRSHFDKGVFGKQAEVDDFTKFVDRVIGLPRNTYKVVMICLSAYETSLRVLSQDINLAFSILIYALETLSQNFDEFYATWDDFEQNQRIKLEEIFKKIDDENVDNIKNVLIKNPHLKLTKRFIEFLKKYIYNDFYLQEAKDIESALKKSDLQNVLINAYNIRSGYVHSLKPLMKQLTIKEFAKGDIFHWKNQPHLTYSGLCRLTHHIIYNFIMSQPYLETEDYYWRNDLPGTIIVDMGPQYWIWKHEGITQEYATIKLEGFLSQLALTNLTDIRDLLKKYEGIIPNASQKYKIQMLTVYYLFNVLIPADCKMDNYIEFVENYESLFEICCIENLITHLYVGEAWPWSANECEEVINTYLKNRYKKNNLKIPGKIEIALFLVLANKYIDSELDEKQKYWLELALYDCPGQSELQTEIKEAIHNKRKMDISKILRPKNDESIEQ